MKLRVKIRDTNRIPFKEDGRWIKNGKVLLIPTIYVKYIQPLSIEQNLII